MALPAKSGHRQAGTHPRATLPQAGFEATLTVMKAPAGVDRRYAERGVLLVLLMLLMKIVLLVLLVGLVPLLLLVLQVGLVPLLLCENHSHCEDDSQESRRCRHRSVFQVLLMLLMLLMLIVLLVLLVGLVPLLLLVLQVGLVPLLSLLCENGSQYENHSQ